MEVAGAPGLSFILKAEDLSMAIMEEEFEHAVICQDKLRESMQSLKPLLMMSSDEEGNGSESFFLNACDIIDQDQLLLSCDELSPGAYHNNWSLDPLTNEPSHYNPTWIRAITCEDFDKRGLPNSSPLPLNDEPAPAQHSPEDMPCLHLFSPPLEADISSPLPLNEEPATQLSSEDVPGLHLLSPSPEAGISGEKQSERESFKQRSSFDEEGWRSKALHNGSKKRSLEGERKWPHLHSFLKGSSSCKRQMPSRNGYESSKASFNNTQSKKSSDIFTSDKRSRNFVGRDRLNTSIDHHTNQSFRFRSKGVKRVGFLKVSSSSESLNHSDNANNYSEDEGSDKPTTTTKGPSSKNLVSERNRRQKLNEKLYSLRALVPNISKMDKASIVGDAITYVRDLQTQVVDMEEDIAHLEASKEAIVNGLLDPTRESKQRRRAINFHGNKTPRQRHQILELNVMQMEEQLYQFCIHCKKTPGVLLQLTRALESLEFEIISANLTSIRDQILNTLLIEVVDKELVRSEDVRERTLEAIPKFGLFMSDS